MYEISDRIIVVPVSQIRQLKDRPMLHAKFDPAGRDKGFVADIKRRGLCTPLLVDERYVLLKGYRRLDALQFLGVSQAPVVVLQSGEKADVFHSVNLARHATPYAKAVAHRQEIQQLVDRGVAQRVSQCDEEKERLDDDWAILCSTVQLEKSTLQMALRVLNKCDELRATGRKEDFDKAEKAESTFRQKGIRPASDLLGDKQCRATADDGPDCKLPSLPRRKIAPQLHGPLDENTVVAAPQVLRDDEDAQAMLQFKHPQPSDDEVFKKFNAFLAIYVSCVGTLSSEDHAAVAHFRERIGMQLQTVAA